METAKKNGAVKKKAPAKKMGRPTKFNPKLGETICLRMANGESLREICRDEKMPTRSSVHLWIFQGRAAEEKTDLSKFSDQYELAVEVRAENMFDELIGIADDGSEDWTTRHTARGDEYDVVDHEVVARSRLRVDTRKWKLSKMLPRKFGDKTTLNTEDKDGNVMPIQGNVIQFASQNNNIDNELDS